MLAALRWAIVATRRLGFLWLPLTFWALTAVLGLNLKIQIWFQLFQFRCTELFLTDGRT
jgi:hypothetical protein